MKGALSLENGAIGAGAERRMPPWRYHEIMRPTLVGVLAGVVLATSCSSTPTEATLTSAPPIHRTVSQPFPTTWQPADDIEQIEALARSELIGQGGSVLVPSNLPQGASGSAGRLTINMTTPPDLLHVDVYVSF